MHRDYSGTPLPTKLGIKEGSTVLVLGAPERFGLGPLPPGVQLRRQARGRLDVVLLFVTRRSDLHRRFPRLASTIEPGGRLWVAWPKRSSGVETDVTFEVVQTLGLGAGLVDNKTAAIDPVFQGLQFVHRREDRPGR